MLTMAAFILLKNSNTVKNHCSWYRIVCILCVWVCLCVCIIYIYIYISGMWIAITDADAIRISMHSQRYNTLKIQMKPLAMQCDAIQFTPITMQWDSISIRFDTMRFDAMEKNMIILFYLVQTDWIFYLCVFWLLTPRGLFHKTSLPNRPGLFQLVWLSVKWFG